MRIALCDVLYICICNVVKNKPCIAKQWMNREVQVIAPRLTRDDPAMILATTAHGKTKDESRTPLTHPRLSDDLTRAWAK